MTALIILENGKPVRQGLEVSIHWSGFFNGFSKLSTGVSGYVDIEDDLLKGSSRKADKIYIENPNGGYFIYFEDVDISQGKHLPLDLKWANHQ